MLRESWLSYLRQQRAIAVIRVNQFELGWHMAAAVAAGGIHCLEITWNSNQPDKLVRQLVQNFPNCKIGVGTILTQTQLEKAIAAGAEFVFTPHTDPVLIQTAIQRGVPIIPGALSPTEIVSAWQAGATCVKVFPIQAMGGVRYLQALQPVLTDIPLIPTGGVTLDNAQDFVRAGAIAVGLSGALFPPQKMAAQDWEAISQQAAALMQSLVNWKV
jgi:2-dehydro-3-deoxyphosphogluconate aldolase/(4S)-4-hydroxy-2-oxoglutarate aldolase